MSVNNIDVHIADGYNYYVIQTPQKRFIIGGIPGRHAEEYIKTAASCDAVVLLTSKPEFSGGISGLLDVRPDIEIYGGSAALRNIKEIVNRPVNERLIKDNMTECGIKFLITPNLEWVDSVMAIYGDVLFSGQAFSGHERQKREYFREHLAVNAQFALNAVNRVEKEGINRIYPAYGKAGNRALLLEYRRMIGSIAPHGRAVIIYSSEYGYTKALAERAAKGLDCIVIDAATADPEKAAESINGATALLIGTHTINRNAPRSIWDIITRIDLVNKRRMPYFVFGSFGWAGEGIKLTDKLLSDMGFFRASKPVEVLFKPDQADFERIDKAVERIKAALI